MLGLIYPKNVRFWQKRPNISPFSILPLQLLKGEHGEIIKITIFYSWQSTTEEKYNRYFIKDCIECATKLKEPITTTFHLAANLKTAGTSALRHDAELQPPNSSMLYPITNLQEPKITVFYLVARLQEARTHMFHPAANLQEVRIPKF